MIRVLGGGRKGSKKHNRSRRLRSRRLRGGHSPSPLGYAEFADGANMSDLAGNMAKAPNAFPSNQVGGGYGFVDNAADIPSFAGSYFPVSKVCTAGEFDLARGGNNLVGGGRRSRRRSNKKKCGGKKTWKQTGCNKKGGHKKRSHRKRRK
jgi:hypothetical protein